MSQNTGENILQGSHFFVELETELDRKKNEDLEFPSLKDAFGPICQSCFSQNLPHFFVELETVLGLSNNFQVWKQVWPNPSKLLQSKSNAWRNWWPTSYRNNLIKTVLFTFINTIVQLQKTLITVHSRTSLYTFHSQVCLDVPVRAIIPC